MKATRAKHDLLRVCVLSCFVFLFTCACTCGAAAAARKTASGRSHKGARSHAHQHGHEHEHRRPLTDEQKADQNLQFMLSLYRSAAGPDGRPKQHRKFGSNTVRLLRPSAASVRHLPASRDHHYRFTVQYNLDTVPSEQLIRASFIHLRSSSSAPSSSSSSPPRCRARITSLGKASLVTLEPHERWTETDITAHVQRGRGHGRLTLEARYWCREESRPAEEKEEGGQESGGLSGWWFRKRRRREPHLEAPSLLLYLEEGREAKDWIGDLLAPDGGNATRQRRLGPPLPLLRRRPRSKDLPHDVLKNAPASPSSFSTSPWSSIISSSIPEARRKTDAPKDRCKLHSFRLSVDELGWGDYFIEPRVYNPRFCQGDCPRLLTYGYHSPNHAIIQTALNELGVGDVPPPSCVPYKYMSMSVLLVHKKKVEYRELEDMLAKSCTCR
ncbi:bone morphogenetic protein 15 [Clinocottus analis]|uniref:bone morphogenetic protein 15 n=1 Tax=Clinocottus analis TaxID=304258 RepID=UPI0035C1047C